jgi:hypothetical protein
MRAYLLMETRRSLLMTGAIVWFLVVMASPLLSLAPAGSIGANVV